MTGREGGWAAARNVLCVRLDNLGDVLMTTPAMRALKQSRPGRRITLLTSPSGAVAARCVPEVDAVIEYSAPWVKQPAATLEGMLPLVHALEAGRFDAAAIFTVYSQSALPAALLCSAAGIPLRLAHCRENPYRLLTEWVGETEPASGLRHEVRRQLDLVASVGCRTDDERLSLSVPPAAVGWVRERLAASGIQPPGDWILVHPGASAPSRRYPSQHWIRALQLLATTHCGRIVIAGAPEDAPAVEAIAAALSGSAIALCGDLDFGRFAALVAAAPVLICCNSGPAHVAAALGTPVVDLYALTNPQHTPWRVPQRVLYRDVSCRFCYRSECPAGHHACMQGIEPGEVAAACRSLLADRGPAPVTTRALLDLFATPDKPVATMV